jgi:hypothetical protein
VNGSFLRLGSINDSHSNLERQDNDLVVMTQKDAVVAFDRKSETQFSERVFIIQHYSLDLMRVEINPDVRAAVRRVTKEIPPIKCFNSPGLRPAL